MRLEDFRFRLTDTESGESAILSFGDLYGYEGETSGVLVSYRDGIPEGMQGEELSFNSGYGMRGMRPGWDIEVVEPDAAHPIVDTLLLEDIDERFIDDEATRYILVTSSGRRETPAIAAARTLALNVGGAKRDDGYRELTEDEAQLVARFVTKAVPGMPPAGRIVLAHGISDDTAFSVVKTIEAALFAEFGLDDLPLWNEGRRRVLPDPSSFHTLLGALGVAMPAEALVERTRRFEKSYAHEHGLWQFGKRSDE